MAGFDDLLKAIQFGTGLAGGFSSQMTQERQKNEANQLALLRLLKDDEHTIESVHPEDLQGGRPGLLGTLFGQPAGTTTTGDTAIGVGGHYFALKKRAAPDMNALLGAASPASTPSAPGEALPTEQPVFGPITPAAPTSAAPPLQQSAQRTLEEPTIPAGSSALKEFAALPSDRRSAILAAARKAAAQSGGKVTVPQLLALMHVESTFDPHAVSPDGAQGLTQLMPGTAQKHRVQDPFNIEQNVAGGAAELAEALDKAGGDFTKAYLQTYNPNDPNRFKAAARLKKLEQEYSSLPALSPKLNGKLSPPTAMSTPEEEAAYRQQNQQQTSQSGWPEFAGQFAGPGAVTPEEATQLQPVTATQSETPTTEPDTSQMVAGEATPTPKAFPTATNPEEWALAQLRQRIGMLQAQGRGLSRKEVDALPDAKIALMRQYEAQIGMARKQADSLTTDEHRPHVLQALQRVQTPEQLAYVQEWMKTQPQRDYLKDAAAYLDSVKKANNGAIPDDKAAEVERVLLQSKYAEPLIKSLLSKAGYVPPEEQRRTAEETARHARGVEDQTAGEIRRDRLTQDRTEKIRQDKETAQGQAFQDIHDALSGNIPPDKLGGMDPYEYAVKRAHMAGMHDEKTWPAQLQEERQLRQPIKNRNERERVDPETYQVKLVRNEKEALDSGYVQVPKEAVQELRGINSALTIMDGVEKDLVSFYQPGGLLADVREGAGAATNIGRRIVGAGTAALNAKSQIDKSLAPVDALLAALSTRTERSIFGERGRTLISLVNQTREQLPNLTGSWTKAPDTREQAYEKWGRFVSLLERIRHEIVLDGALPHEHPEIVLRMKNAEQAGVEAAKKALRQ